MTAYRSHGRGTLWLKVTLGTIKLDQASGTNDPKLLRRLKEMLHTLWEAGRGELIQGVKDKLYSPLDLWQHYSQGKWEALPSPTQVRPLEPMLAAWSASQTNRFSRVTSRTYVRRILEHAGPNPTLASLPKAIAGYREVAESKGHAQQFNHARAAAHACIRVTPGLGRHSPLWLAVAQVPRLPVTRKFPPNPQRPAQAWAIRERIGGEDGRIWWWLCCTGMGPDEYFEDKWAVEDGRLHIYGTKRKGRDRLVPLVVDDLERTTLNKAKWQDRFRRKRFGVTPYDGRRSFSIWMAEAGIPEHRHAAYMGHGARSQTLHYQRVTDQYLDEDETLLRALLSGILHGSETGVHRRIGTIPRHSTPSGKGVTSNE